jgi:polyphosphate glucokinase
MTRRRPKTPTRTRVHARNALTLSIDIGGTHIKAAVLDIKGREVGGRVEADTPHPSPPPAVLDCIATLVSTLTPYDRISAGFPGVVVGGNVVTAPNLGTEDWKGFALAAALTKRFAKPARVINDAEVQGLGVISGRGLECVLTLGTGFGSALYRDGALMPHLELGQHPVWKDKTYDQYLGLGALKKKGPTEWNKRVRRAITIVHTLLNYDHLYIGGGNAAHIDFELPPNVTIVSNEAGITGGIALWQRSLDDMFAT